MESNDPTKLHIYFGLSHSPPWFFELEQSGRRNLFDLLTKVKCKEQAQDEEACDTLCR